MVSLENTFIIVPPLEQFPYLHILCHLDWGYILGYIDIGIHRNLPDSARFHTSLERSDMDPLVLRWCIDGCIQLQTRTIDYFDYVHI